MYYTKNIAYNYEEFSDTLVFITLILTVNTEQMLMGKHLQEQFTQRNWSVSHNKYGGMYSIYLTFNITHKETTA